MSDREEGNPSPLSLPPLKEGSTAMNLPLQEAVYALMAQANLLKYHAYGHRQSSRSSLPPVKDSARPFEKRRFCGTGGVDDSGEIEKNTKKDHKPKSAPVDQDSLENEKKEKEDSLGIEINEEVNEPAEVDPFALVLLSGVAREIGFWKKLYSPSSSVKKPPLNPNDVGNDSRDNVENNEEDKKLIFNLAKKLSDELKEHINSLTEATKAIKSYKMRNHDTGRRVEGTSGDQDDSHVAEERTERKIPMKDSKEPWNHLDTEIAVFENILDYKAKKGWNPLSDNNALADFITNWLHINIPVGQFNDLMQFLRQKYEKKAGKRPANAKISKTKLEKVLELAHEIWG